MAIDSIQISKRANRVSVELFGNFEELLDKSTLTLIAEQLFSAEKNEGQSRLNWQLEKLLNKSTLTLIVG